MKIVETSATLIEKELAGLSVCQRIDRCASVCYQRPPKPTEEEARAFCRKLIERGHLPALEFAVVHLLVDLYRVVDIPVSNYLQYKQIGNADAMLVSGSIRAFRGAKFTDETSPFLAESLPDFFQTDPCMESDGTIRFAATKEIPWQHKHAAVRVICSRAISHQLVRHRPCSFLQESQRYCRYDDEVTFIRPEWASESKSSRELFSRHCLMSDAMYKARAQEGCSPQQARGALINDVKTELIMYASLPEWLHIFAMRCAKAADPEARRVMLPLREQFRREYPEAFENE